MEKIEGYLFRYEDGTEVFEPKEKQEGGNVCPNIILVRNDRNHIKATTRSFIMHLNVPRRSLDSAPRSFISQCNSMLQELCARREVVERKLAEFDRENMAAHGFNPDTDAFGY
ncbi:MAG: hypothetical protein MJZ36_01415 [Bacteroidaceae bacterium]|nr:hypothetical protein [Bacteroidaceae bacterium]